MDKKAVEEVMDNVVENVQEVENSIEDKKTSKEVRKEIRDNAVDTADTVYDVVSDFLVDVLDGDGIDMERHKKRAKEAMSKIKEGKDNHFDIVADAKEAKKERKQEKIDNIVDTAHTVYDVASDFLVDVLDGDGIDMEKHKEGAKEAVGKVKEGADKHLDMVTDDIIDKTPFTK